MNNKNHQYEKRAYHTFPNIAVSQEKNFVSLVAKATAMLLVALLTACGGGSGSSDNTDTTTPSGALITAVGTTNGTETSATIGAAGGDLTSDDGLLALSVPANALADDASIQVQPITNKATGGVGKAYRLTADTQTFSQPVTLTFTYKDDDLVGSSPDALGIAFQTSAGYWQLVDKVSVDKVNKTISVQTTHLLDNTSADTVKAASIKTKHVADWAYVEKYRLRPGWSSVKVNNSLSLHVEMAFDKRGPRPADGGESPYVGIEWSPMSLNIGALFLGDWAVNGVNNGNATVGTINPNVNQGGYTAPATRPQHPTVQVSVELKSLADEKLKALLVSNITIVEGDTYSGTLMFNGKSDLYGSVTEYSGTAYAQMVEADDFGDGKRYDLDSEAEFTNIKFDTLNYHDEGKTCQALLNTLVLEPNDSQVDSLLTYFSLQEYVFSIHYTVNGQQECTYSDTSTGVEDIDPLTVTVQTQTGATGSPSEINFQPLGDGTTLSGSATFTDPEEGITTTTNWSFVKN